MSRTVQFTVTVEGKVFRPIDKFFYVPIFAITSQTGAIYDAILGRHF